MKDIEKLGLPQTSNDDSERAHETLLPSEQTKKLDLGLRTAAKRLLERVVRPPHATDSTDPLPTEEQAPIAIEPEKEFRKFGMYTEDIASAFHEIWARTRLMDEHGSASADGVRAPRIKEVTSPQSDLPVGEVDIANKIYPHLPEQWKKENKAAAEVIIDLIHREFGDDLSAIDLEDPETYSHCGEVIHDAWLSRNPYALDGELGVPFDELPQNEKDKDLEQLRFALKVLGPDPNEATRPFKTRIVHEVNNWALKYRLPIRDRQGKLIHPSEAYYLDQAELFEAGRR